MKPLYRCEYCNQTGTAEEIEKHEIECANNYNLKSCRTCIHYVGLGAGLNAICDANVQDIPPQRFKVNCSSYERNYEAPTFYSDFARTFFGGVPFDK